jgi:hypothetical protein
LFLNWQLLNNLDSSGEYSLHTWIQKLRHFVNTIAQFTNAQRFIAAFTSEKLWMTIKKLIPQLAIYTEFFHSAFVNPYTMRNQTCSRSGVRLSAHLAIESLIANYCMSWRGIFKGLSQDGGWADFSKNLRDTSFYKDRMSLISA